MEHERDHRHDPAGLRARVVGPYRGVNEVLASLLTAAGVGITTAEPGPAAVTVAVVTPQHPPPPDVALVVVAWHPDDELPALPDDALVVRAGRVRADLTAAVTCRASLLAADDR